MGKCKKERKPTSPYLKARPVKGRFVSDFKDLRKNYSIFKTTFQVTPKEFDCLLCLLEPYIEPKRKTRPCDGISPAEKLALTLEFYAIRRLEHHLGSSYRINASCISGILNQVTDAIEWLIEDKLYGDENLCETDEYAEDYAVEDDEDAVEDAGEDAVEDAEEDAVEDAEEHAEEVEQGDDNMPLEKKDPEDADREPSLTTMEQNTIDFILGVQQ